MVLYLNILWDLDGTVVDTVPSLVETFCLFAEKYYGIAVDKDIAEELTKINSELLFEQYSIEFNQDNVEKFREVNRTISIDKTPLFDGVIEVLEKSTLNVLVTNRNRRSTLEILRYWDIEKYFVEVICVDDGYPKKPDATSYEYLDRKFQIDLVIGDRDVDFEPARKLGIKTCVYKNPNVRADYYIGDYKDF